MISTMTWKETILFHLKSNDGSLSRRTAENLVMPFFSDYGEVARHIVSLVNDGLCDFDRSTGKIAISPSGNLYIESTFQILDSLMHQVTATLNCVENKFSEIQVQGGVTGMYFLYRSQTFRFYPNILNDEANIKVRLPNTLDEAKGFSANTIFVNSDILKRTNFLEEVVISHIKMLSLMKGTSK